MTLETMFSPEAFEIIKEMQSDNVIGRFAIGGAFATIFYKIEAAETEDVDVFVDLAANFDELMGSVTRINSYLERHGGIPEGGAIRLEGTLIQILPPEGKLVEDAILHAVPQMFAGIEIPVFTAEYLAAIALKLGRPKDRSCSSACAIPWNN